MLLTMYKGSRNSDTLAGQEIRGGVASDGSNAGWKNGTCCHLTAEREANRAPVVSRGLLGDFGVLGPWALS